MDDDSVQKHQDDTQEQSEKPPERRANTKQDNPLLKMFAKMRERNVSLKLIIFYKQKRKLKAILFETESISSGSSKCVIRCC